MSSGTNPVSSGGVLNAGSELTLVAAVTSGAANLTTGQVNFCDAAATYCTDIHLLGTAQLTSAGTAVLRFRPGVGNHSYKAVFVGTPNGSTAYGNSTSGMVTLSVTGTYLTATTIAQGGSIGNYTLTATVSSSVKNTDGPTGTISFIDTGANNTVLATAPLGSAVVTSGFVNVSNPQVGNLPGAIITAAFNGDGNLDLAVE